MLQKILGTMALIVLLLSPGGVARAAAPAKDYSADRFETQIAIQQGGSLLVTETVVFRFVGGPFTYVFRDIPTDQTDGISILSAGIDNQTLTQGTGAGQVEIAGGNPLKVTWHFAPISDQVHAFRLSYRVQGVVQKTAGADALYWNALPTSYQYTIRSSIITVSYPENVALLGSPEVRRGPAEVSTLPNQAIFLASNLAPNTPLEIGLRFRPGSIIATAPHWQQVQAIVASLILPSLVGGVILFLLGMFGFIWYYRRHRRRSPIIMNTVQGQGEPPNEFPPAIASALVSPTGAPTWASALATVFNLASRGVMRISDNEVSKKWYQSRDFTIQQQAMPSNLRPYEVGLLQALFPDPQAPWVQVSRITSVYTKQSKLFTEPVKQDMIALGLFDAERQRIRGRLGMATLLVFVVALLAGAVALGFGLATGMWPFVFLPVGLALSCMAGLIVWSMYSPLSDEGAQAAAYWKAFSKYLSDLSQSKAAPPAPDTFERYLPYAVGFGLAASWTRYFQKQGLITVPPWFQSLAGAPDESMHSFVAMMTTTTAIDHSSAGAAAAGAAGAAGGGASGAG
ncbi:MAG: DUF2207 domain-containing protein [Ktedonobacteraceae bacterium]|nr:DUF2207 domain-containing protein [Ktedonobacteraceae bacterium]